MDLYIYIFDLLLEVFITFTIFAIYLYVLFKFFIHSFEELGLVKFFKIHLQFYSPIIKLYKLSSYNTQNPSYLQDYLQQKIDNVVDTPDKTDYTIATYSILGGILGLFLIVCIYALIFHKKIMEQMSFIEVLIKIAVNAGLILMFELLFLFFVYGNTDLFNLSKALNL
jgi:hypothetical protein